MNGDKSLKSIGVTFPQGVDPLAWSESYGKGDVPDEWPYGLHRLRNYADNLTGRVGRPLSTVDKMAIAARCMAPNYYGRGNPRAPFHEIGISWDEISAAKMITQLPAERMYSGVIWATDEWVSSPSRRSAVVKRLLSSLAGLWCLSRPQVEVLERETKNRVPVSFLPFGIDQEFFRYTARDQDHPVRIISLGVDRDRDPQTLFAVLEMLQRAVPSAEIMVQSSSEYTVPAGVTRIPRIPHAALRDLYQTASLVLIPTKHNLHASGMTVALEAAASGRPVVTCDTPGMDDYVIDGVTGLLVEPGDAKAMASAALELITDSQLAADMGIKGRSLVECNYNSAAMMRHLAGIIS